MKMIVDLNLENCIYQPSGDIKLPYGEVVPFSEFKEDMNLRISKATRYTINEI